MFVKVNSCANIGINSELVEVETDQTKTDQTFFVIVGLPDTAIQEAKERVRLAVKNSGFYFPRYKTIVNLAPADLKKEGPAFDLAIAVSILKSTEQVYANLESSLFVGELALDGKLRHTNGILPIAIFAKQKGFESLFIPAVNSGEAALISDLNIYPVESISQLVDHLHNIKLIEPIKHHLPLNSNQDLDFAFDMADVQGQEQAKRALEIAASGGHNLLMSGPPGSGKTLLAKTMPSILPTMDEDEIIEVTKLYSIAGLLPKDKPFINERPFRSPHHTSSGVALVGGGRIPKPGEISLSHRGVLFLDEFPEFPRPVLENLRQPMEDGVISISRAQGTLSFPARFTLIASQNPCPCGYLSDPEKNCVCSQNSIFNYQKKISGPLLDRIDIQIEVPRIKFEKLNQIEPNESSEKIRQRVQKARQIQLERFAEYNFKCNSEMPSSQIKFFCELDETSITLLKSALEQFHLSSRSYYRIIKVARTIADLENSKQIKSNHVAEALQFRIRQS